MLDRLADVVLRRPRAVLLVTLLLVLSAGAMSSGLMDRLTMGGYESGITESYEAAEAVENTFDQGEANLVLLVQDSRGVDHPAVSTAGQALTARLAAEPGVVGVESYWSLGGAEPLRGNSGEQALVLGVITGDFDQVQDRVTVLQESYTGTVEGLETTVGGSALMWKENTERAARDATLAESLVFPLVLIVLIIIFGSLVAAMVPLAVAIATVLMAMFVMWMTTLFVDGSNFVVNIITFLGLGLAVDYSLLFVTRYREELGNGLDVADAIRATLKTTGRTVIFSAVTVAVAFVSLLVLPFTMFSSLAAGAIATALLAAASTVIVVPALLCWAGPRIEKLRLIKKKERPTPVEEGFWHRVAVFVMGRPVTVLIVVVAFLLLLGTPVLDMKLRLPDEQVLPTEAQSAQVMQDMKADFNTQEQQTLQVVAQGIGEPSSRTADISTYAQRLSALPGVARVDALTGTYVSGAQVTPAGPQSARYAAPAATYLSVVPSVDGYSTQGEELVRAVRQAQRPFPVIVGGSPAVSVDTFDLLRQRLPIALTLLLVGMFVLLFLMTGSVVLPLKAIVLSALSLTATFGALVFIFQNGHLQWLVGDFIVTGAITWTVPVIVFAVAFALSMDYEVFMISRIKEEYDRTGNNSTAIAGGLQRVGRVITYAALLLSLVFVVLTTSGISYMKAIGIGLPLSILMDATLIRGAVLPAAMKLFGKANWWAPAPLKRLHARLGIDHRSGDAPAWPAASKPAAKSGMR